MRGSGLDLRSHTFKRVVRGFDEAEVLAALEAATPEYEKARATLTQLEEELAVVAADVERLRQSEQSLLRVCTAAEDQGRHRIADGQREAARIVEAAEARAAALVARAEAERAAMVDEVTAIAGRRWHLLSTVSAVIDEYAAPAAHAKTHRRPAPRPSEAVPDPTRPAAALESAPQGVTLSPAPPAEESTVVIVAAETAPLTDATHEHHPVGDAPHVEDAVHDADAHAERSSPRGRAAARRPVLAVAAVALAVAAIAWPALNRHDETAPTQAAVAGPPSSPAAVAAGPISAPAAPRASQDPVPTAPLVLRLEAVRECWVRLSVDGRSESVLLDAGKAITRGAEHTIQLRIGDAAAARLALNGQALPPLGRDGQVVDRTITLADVTTASSRSGSR